MTAQKLIEILSSLPPETKLRSFYDFEELEIKAVYKRSDGDVVLSHDEGNSQEPGNQLLG